MNVTFATEVKYLKGVGPQRAETLASRGILTRLWICFFTCPSDMRTAFASIRFAEIAPGGTYTIHGTVADSRCRNRTVYPGAEERIFHLVLQDSSGPLPCKFFHGGYMQGRFKVGQEMVAWQSGSPIRDAPAESR